jgi:hypothetical protein
MISIVQYDLAGLYIDAGWAYRAARSRRATQDVPFGATPARAWVGLLSRSSVLGGGCEREDGAMSDAGFDERLADRLFELPGIEAVALGGSRAQGTARPDSDWDFGIYYRSDSDPESLRDVGWPGEVFGVGEWGGGVFNGGAWLEVEGRRVDVHYRDLDSVEHELSEAAAGRFHIEALMFHLAGIPSYIVVAELALHQLLRGSLPRPAYPSALRARAPEVWWRRAEQLFAYAYDCHVPRGRVAPCVGLVVQATSCAAHGVLARRAEWVTNEKPLLTRAGLDDLDRIVTSTEPHDLDLALVVTRARELCAVHLEAATAH